MSPNRGVCFVTTGSSIEEAPEHSTSTQYVFENAHPRTPNEYPSGNSVGRVCPSPPIRVPVTRVMHLSGPRLGRTWWGKAAVSKPVSVSQMD